MSQTPVPITGGTGTSSIAAELVAGTSFQQVEIYGGGGASVLSVNPDGSIKVSVIGTLTLTSSFVQPSSLVSGTTSIITSTGQTSVLGTAPSGQRNYITQILVTNGSGTSTFVDVMDGPSVIYRGYAAASGGGFSASFPTPLKQANTQQSVDMRASVQASIVTAMSGYTAA